MLSEITIKVPSNCLGKIIGIVAVMLANEGEDPHANAILYDNANLTPANVDAELQLCTELYAEKKAPQYDFENYPNFHEPSIEEVRAYVLSKGYEDVFDADAFFRACEAKNWILKTGEHMMRYTAMIDTSVERGYYKGKTAKPEAPKPLPATLIKPRHANVLTDNADSVG